MLRKVHRTIRSHKLVRPGNHVLVAVSGGADSTALLDIMRRLTSRLGIRLTAAHLNHRLRGRESDRDQAFVEDVCREAGIPCIVESADVAALAKREKISVEMAARQARYAFFGRLAKETAADALATAHTLDDQAETVILRLARGAGLRGLGGIARTSTMDGLKVIRPLLDATRKDILEYLRSHSLEWKEDSTNRQTDFLRNRVRHRIIPLLESELNPRIRQVLARTADILRAEEEWADECAFAVINRLSGRKKPALISVSALARQPAALRSRLVRLWLAGNGIPADTTDYETVQRILALSGTPGRGGVRLTDSCRAVRAGDMIGIEDGRSGKSVFGNPPAVQIQLSGITSIPALNLRVTVRRAGGIVRARGGRPGDLPSRASLSLSRAGGKRLQVRTWRAGDRMKPFGLGGTKKLQDIFVDAGVPAAMRTAIPIVCSGREIVWIPGYRIAQGWEVKPGEKTALQIRMERAVR